MVRLEDYYNENTIALTETLIGQSDDGEFLSHFFEMSKSGDIDSMYSLAYELIRHRTRRQDIHTGIAWLLKIVDDCESERVGSASISGEFNESLFRAKRFLACVFLPRIPLIDNSMKPNACAGISEDPEFGFKMLADVCQSPLAEADDWIMISMTCYLGFGTKADANNAKKHLQKAIEMDASLLSRESAFISYLSLLFETDTNHTLLASKIMQDNANEFADRFACKQGLSKQDILMLVDRLYGSPEWIEAHKTERDLVEALFADENELGRIYIWNCFYSFHNVLDPDCDSCLDIRCKPFFSEKLWLFFNEASRTMAIQRDFYNGNQNGPLQTKRLSLVPMTQEYNAKYNERLRENGCYESYYNSPYKERDVVHWPFHYAILDKQGSFLGMIGFAPRYYPNDFVPLPLELNVEYILFPDYRGNGYAKEALLALSDFLFSGKALIEQFTPYRRVRKVAPFTPKRLLGDAWIENKASIKTLEACGFVFCEIKDGEDGIYILSLGKKEPAAYYELTYDEWQKKRSPGKAQEID